MSLAVYIALAVAALIVAVGVVSRRTGARPSPMAAEANDSPGRAVSFGHKCAWLAVKHGDPPAVLAALGAANVREAGWSELGLAGGGRLFATPTLDGWVLVVGDFPDVRGEEDEPLFDLVTKLSADLATEVQSFGTHRVVEYHAWLRARNGHLIRAYAYLGESGQLLADEGEASSHEQALDLWSADDPAPEDDDDWEDQPRGPDEDDVIDVAAHWSINPAELEERGEVGTGWIADWQR